jgi:4-amino-4-deoxy-L-arabinose transferase-like glycosyltransferase
VDARAEAALAAWRPLARIGYAFPKSFSLRALLRCVCAARDLVAWRGADLLHAARLGMRMTGSGTAAGLGASPGGESRAFAVRPAPLWILWLGLAVLLMQAAPYLSYRWLPDESWYAATGYSAEQGTGFKDVALAPNDIEGRIDTRPPGTALSAALIFRTLGVSAAKARLAPLLAGLGIVSLVFLFARQVFDEASTLIAVLLAACDTFVVGASRTVRPEALTTLFVMLALLALLGYSRRGRWIFALLAGMAMGVGALCHITIGGFIAACAVLVFVLDVRRGVLPVRGVACFLAGFFAALLPFVGCGDRRWGLRVSGRSTRDARERVRWRGG